MPSDPWEMFLPAVRTAWEPTGANPMFVHGWITGGWTADTLPPGWSRLHHHAWGFVITGDLPQDPAWGELCGLASPEFAAYAHGIGKGPAETMRLAQAVNLLHGRRPVGAANEAFLFGSTVTAGSALDDLMFEVARRAEHLNWADLATCVDAGMSLDDAIAHVQRGREMGPVRLMAALAH